MFLSKSVQLKTQFNKPFSFKKSYIQNPKHMIHYRKRNIKCSLNSNDYVHVVSSGIVYFTMIYCTLNWYNYRTIREAYEKDMKNKDKKKK